VGGEEAAERRESSFRFGEGLEVGEGAVGAGGEVQVLQGWHLFQKPAELGQGGRVRGLGLRERGVDAGLDGGAGGAQRADGGAVEVARDFCEHVACRERARGAAFVEGEDGGRSVGGWVGG